MKGTKVEEHMPLSASVLRSHVSPLASGTVKMGQKNRIDMKYSKTNEVKVDWFIVDHS